MTTPLRILHLSDTHLMAGDGLHQGVVDTTAALGRVLARAADLTELDAVVLSGDLSDDGTEETYRHLAALIEPWAAERGAVVVYAMGNHDVRQGFSAVLGELDGVREVRGFRIVHLDSSVPGAGYGEFTDQQLAWLADRLATPAPHGTVVVAHHPPVPAATDLLAALELVAPQRFLDVCAAGDVRLILAGHYHHPLVTRVECAGRSIDVAVAPAVTNVSDVCGPRTSERALRGSGFALVELAVDGPPRVIAVPVGHVDDGQLVFDLGPDQVAAIAAAAGPRR